MADVVARLDSLNTAIAEALNAGDTPAAQIAALFDSRALAWGQLAELAHRDADDGGRLRWYATACAYAAILDQQDAAEWRFGSGVPTLRPQTEAALLRLRDRVCDACGRPWQLDRDGACETCPRLLFGHPDAGPAVPVDPTRLNDTTLED